LINLTNAIAWCLLLQTAAVAQKYCFLNRLPDTIPVVCQQTGGGLTAGLHAAFSGADSVAFSGVIPFSCCDHKVFQYYLCGSAGTSILDIYFVPSNLACGCPDIPCKFDLRFPVSPAADTLRVAFTIMYTIALPQTFLDTLIYYKPGTPVAENGTRRAAVAKRATAPLAIYDVSGRLVARIDQPRRREQMSSIANGLALPSGVYFLAGGKQTPAMANRCAKIRF
jgi:hypothetical protein